MQEWDKIWAINKRIIDPVCPRHTAVKAAGRARLRLNNGPAEPEIVTVPRHKKYPPAGVKATTRTQVSPAYRMYWHADPCPRQSWVRLLGPCRVKTLNKVTLKTFLDAQFLTLNACSSYHLVHQHRGVPFVFRFCNSGKPCRGFSPKLISCGCRCH